MRGRLLHLAMGVLGAALAAALAVALVGCTTSGTTPAASGAGSGTEPIKIGAIVSLTGSYAGLGEPEKKTIEMEVAKINDAGGINGRKVEVIFEDDGTDNTKAVAAVTKLISQDKVVAIIGSTGTGQSMAIRNEIDRAGIPQVSMAGGDPASCWPLSATTAPPGRHTRSKTRFSMTARPKGARNAAMSSP